MNFKELSARVQVMRDQTAASLPGDCFVESGDELIKVRGKEEDAKLLAAYDDLIATIRDQVGTA